MNEFMIVIFGLSTIRTLLPLVEEENWRLSKILVALTTCWAFYHLLFNCSTITISF